MLAGQKSDEAEPHHVGLAQDDAIDVRFEKFNQAGFGNIHGIGTTLDERMK